MSLYRVIVGFDLEGDACLFVKRLADDSYLDEEELSAVAVDLEMRLNTHGAPEDEECETWTCPNCSRSYGEDSEGLPKECECGEPV